MPNRAVAPAFTPRRRLSPRGRRRRPRIPLGRPARVVAPARLRGRRPRADARRVARRAAGVPLRAGLPLSRICLRAAERFGTLRTRPCATSLPSSRVMSQRQSWPVRPWWTGTACTSSCPSRWARRKSVWLERPTANWPAGSAAVDAPMLQAVSDRRRVDAAVHHALDRCGLGAGVDVAGHLGLASGAIDHEARALHEARSKRRGRDPGGSSSGGEAIVGWERKSPVGVSAFSRPRTTCSAATERRAVGVDRIIAGGCGEDYPLSQLRRRRTTSSWRSSSAARSAGPGRGSRPGGARADSPACAVAGHLRRVRRVVRARGLRAARSSRDARGHRPRASRAPGERPPPRGDPRLCPPTSPAGRRARDTDGFARERHILMKGTHRCCCRGRQRGRRPAPASWAGCCSPRAASVSCQPEADAEGEQHGADGAVDTARRATAP